MATVSNTTTSINTSSSGRTYVTGTASGLNTQALITSALSKYTKQQTTLNTQINTNTSKISAYQSLKSQITSFQTVLDSLKSSTNTVDSTSTTSTTSSVFDTKSVSLTTSDNSSSSSLVSVTADSTASAGTHTVVVTQVAKTQQVTSDAQTSSSTALGFNGSFSLNITGNTAVAIDVQSTDSLTDIKNAINAQQSTTGVSADILQSGGTYKLVLSGTSTNKTINVSNVTGDDLLTSLGVTDGSGSFNHITQPAQPAQITLDNSTISNDSNNFEDVLTGFSIDVLNAAPSTTITVKVGNNVSGVKSAVNSLISAYNSLYDSIHAHEKVNSDGTVDSNQYLHGDTVLNSLSSQLKAILTSSGNNASGNYNSLGALGITVGSDNHLSIKKQTTFDDALNNHFSEVQSFFSSQFTSSDSHLTVSTNNTSLNTDFTLDISANGAGNINSASLNGDSSVLTISGNVISGKKGSNYEGLSLTYHGTTNTSASVTIQQGWADKLVNLLDNFTNKTTGSINKAITSLQDSDTTLQNKINDLKTASAKYEDSLINKYSAMEAAISKAKSLQSSIFGILGLNTSSNN